VSRRAISSVIAMAPMARLSFGASYQEYYNESRTHLSLKKDAPIPRDAQRVGRVVALPILGGLHHQYVRV
jgi:hypothetical protein